MSTEDNNTQTNSVAISSEQTQGKPTQSHVGRTLRDSSIEWQAVVSELKQSYPDYHERALSRILRMKRSRVHNWMHGKARPSVDVLQKLSVELKRMAAAALRCAGHVDQELIRRKGEPRRVSGFMAVIDHGDGLPPHNRQLHTLIKLGLVKRDQLGKSLASQKPKGD